MRYRSLFQSLSKRQLLTVIIPTTWFKSPIHIQTQAFTVFLTILLTGLSSLISVHAQAPDESGSEGMAQTQGAGEDKEAMSMAPQISPEQRLQDLLSTEIDGDALRWLNSEDGKFLGLWNEDITGKPFGAVLLLHGEGENADWPNTVNALREKLPHFGWFTLSISLPEAKPPAAPPRPPEKVAKSPTDPAPEDTEGETNNNGTETKDDMEMAADKTMAEDSDKEAVMMEEQAEPDMKAEMDQEPARNADEVSNARLGEAVKFLNQQGQYNIVIVAGGVNAARAAKFIHNAQGGASPMKDGAMKATGAPQMNKIIRAMVLLGARNHIPETNEQLENFLKDPGLPVLDVVYGSHYLDEFEAKKRLRQTQKNRLPKYYQLTMRKPSDYIFEGENRLTKRVRGFLNKNAKGVEIDSNR